MKGDRLPARGGDPAHAPASDESGATLRRLRALAIGGPVIFLVALEAARALLLDDGVPSWGHLAVAGVMALGAIAFATVIFRMIERSQNEMRRMNRDLGAITSVSGALREAVSMDEAITAGVAAIIGWTGATDARVTILPTRRDHPENGVAAAPVPPLAAEGGRVVVIPLETPTRAVGRLELHIPDGACEQPGPDAMRNIGEHLASSIRVAQLVEMLRRRRREEHGLNELLFSISGRERLSATLAALARQARDLLEADDVLVRLEERAIRSLPAAEAASAARARRDPQEVAILAPAGAAEQEEAAPAGPHTMTCPISGGTGPLGQIVVARHADTPFRRRDRAVLVAIGELGSLAVTAAQARGREIQVATVAERERIAREMHDGLAQALGVIHLRLRALGGRPETVAAGAYDEVADLAEIAEDAYRDVREALLGLREASRVDREFLEGLRVYLDKFSRQSGIATYLDAPVDGGPDLPPHGEVQVIRVVQEALTNARKHSGARAVTVRVDRHDDVTTVVVEDDGCGFEAGAVDTSADGFGLQAMRERMELVGGTLTVDSVPGRGTRVVAICPCASVSRRVAAAT